jgi:hypothetical protein
MDFGVILGNIAQDPEWYPVLSLISGEHYYPG